MFFKLLNGGLSLMNCARKIPGPFIVCIFYILFYAEVKDAQRGYCNVFFARREAEGAEKVFVNVQR